MLIVLSCQLLLLFSCNAEGASEGQALQSQDLQAKLAEFGLNRLIDLKTNEIELLKNQIASHEQLLSSNIKWQRALLKILPKSYLTKFFEGIT
jgi:hypothetical protein